ncbi:hypothetical protein [Streptomyces apocyni]|uniref:hypothetical protein n=1 Tax=Streptomyces apocyni TaxID=2654677 RepID=UPI0012EAE8DE|nr:hypothetical protein [Streptomyces apocyni]
MARPSRTPRGPHISRVPGKPVERDADGRLTIPLWLQQDGRFGTDLTLRLTPAEAEALHAQLCFALDADPVTTPPGDPTPDCRKPTRGPTGVRWP